MKPSNLKQFIAFTGMLWVLVTSSHAFPPAPDHVFYGMVRNELGDPIDLSGARVFIVSTHGGGANTPVSATTQPGINYRLTVPMDSGLSRAADPASVGSLREHQAFQLKVQIGTTTYLPIEMLISRSIGEPAASTRLDLTLGVDSDGDGLPDAWELAHGLNPNDPIDADGDADGDGVSNRNEYLAGTDAFDPKEGFRITLIGSNNGNTAMEFLTIRGRSYTVHASSNLQQWTPVSFRVVAGNVPGTLQTSYAATAVRNLRIEVPFEEGSTNLYFRGMIQ